MEQQRSHSLVVAAAVVDIAIVVAAAEHNRAAQEARSSWSLRQEERSQVGRAERSNPIAAQLDEAQDSMLTHYIRHNRMINAKLD